MRFVWLEITGKCQLQCIHCYASSGPDGSHGTMSLDDWKRVIDEAAELGVSDVQFIGGEPTLHPGLPELIAHAARAKLRVEIYSNLVHVPPALWQVIGDHGVSLACSYYSDKPGEHARITGRATSHRRTRANIAEALRRSVALRVGVVDLGGNQRVQSAISELVALGVSEIGVDTLRGVGRGAQDQTPPATDALCGHCCSNVLAISSDGSVWPCVFSRWLTVGNARTHTLTQILHSDLFHTVQTQLRHDFAQRTPDEPDTGDPNCHPAWPPAPNPLPCDPCSPYCLPQCGPSCTPECQPVRY
jgi:MoaA/NifB/PqqE/SkfB family radical SAM enzyme